MCVVLLFISPGSWHDRCVSLTWLMTSKDWRPWRAWRAFVREDKPSEWCWRAEGTLASGRGLSAACLQQVLLGSVTTSGAGRVWLWRVPDRPVCLVWYHWHFKAPLLSAQLVTKSLADRLPVRSTVVLVQHCFSWGFFYRGEGVDCIIKQAPRADNSEQEEPLQLCTNKQQDKRRQVLVTQRKLIISLQGFSALQVKPL